MKKQNVLIHLIISIFALGASTISVTVSAEALNPTTVIKTMEDNFGVHQGYRRNHAKGFCATGEFKASTDAKKYSRSVLFNGKAHPVTARFSSATGLPTLPDTTKAPHGMALRFDLGKGVWHNMSMINAPVFVAATPEAFFETFKLSTPEAVTAYQTKYPESKPFFTWLNQHNPPASYASAAFHSLNAFEFLNAKKKSQFVRWHFVPEAGEKDLTAEELAKATPNYLEDEFKARTEKGATRWTMMVTLAEAGDSVTNSTAIWPESRKTISFGTLTLSKYEAQEHGPCDKINFDPNLVSDGVKASDDPVLKFRSPAYAVSFGKRISEPSTRAPSQAADDRE